MKKESFIIHNSYYEPIKNMTDEQLGQLFRAIFEYSISEKNNISREIEIPFMFFKNQMDMDKDKYEKTCKKRSEAGKKGMENRWNKDITNDNKCYQTITNDNKNNKRYQTITNITDNDNDNDNDNDIINKKINKKRFTKPTVDEIKEYCNERNNNINFDNFYNYYEANGWKVGRNSMKDWKACIRTWETKEKKQPQQQDIRPSWYGKEIKTKELTKKEQEEMKDLLKGFN